MRVYVRVYVCNRVPEHWVLVYVSVSLFPPPSVCVSLRGRYEGIPPLMTNYEV